MAAPSSVQEKVQEWLSLDADAASRAIVEGLVAKAADSELEELMCKRLEFGEQPIASPAAVSRTSRNCCN